ncbi:hypothetical protein JCM11491_003742 [Sporobolomyces phaffii]
MAAASPHLLSGLGKEWSPPQFSKDEPRRKFRPTFTEPLSSYFPPANQHPDEEKGRSIRSLTRVPSDSTAFPYDRPRASLAAAFHSINLGLSDDSDAFLDDWAADRSAATAHTDLPRVEIGPVPPSQDFPVRNKTDAEIWTAALEHAVAHADGKIGLSHKRLARIPDNISELSSLRKMSPFPHRPLDRPVQSTPSMFGAAPATPKPPVLPKSPRTFGRSSSIASSPAARAPVATAVPLNIDLAGNQLTANSLSNALFGLDNLRCLWLRKNELDRLPPGIGRLTNLVDLSLSTNQLEYLPAEILRLENLATLTLHPNPFLPPPPANATPSASLADPSALPSVSPPTSSRTASRLLGPLTTHFTVPSLREIALRKLLDADPDKPCERLVQRWESTSVRDSLPAHDYAAFASVFPTAAAAASSSLSSSSSSSGVRADFVRSRHASASSTASVVVDAQPFDPLANVCRSPVHPDEDKTFFEPAVERFEWVEERALKPCALDRATPGGGGGGGAGRSRGLRGPRTIPIKWRGCSARCLDWLEEDEDDDESL